jgi:competence protein ComEA
MTANLTCKMGASLALAFSLALLAVPSSDAQELKTKPKVAGKTKPAAKHVDLNAASAEELQTLPGIGEAYSKKIIDGRPYKSVEDLSKIGIPAKTVDEIKPLVVVKAPAAEPAAKKRTTQKKAAPVTPTAAVDLNTADLAALETLPGIGPALAKSIIAGRPYKSVDELERVKGLGAAKIATLKEHVVVSSSAPTTPAEPPAAAEATPAKAATPKATKPKSEAVPKAAMTKGTAKSKPTTKPLAPGEKININTASKEELDRLPGIGPVYAQAIIDARPFKMIEDIMKVKGIKEVEFGKIKDMITIK